MTSRSPDPIETLLAAVEEMLDRPATSADQRLFRRYLDVFLRWNRVHRMTAIESSEQIVQDLFIDSLLFLKALPARRPLAVVDIGAGGGIPGLPMRLADPGIRLTLVEARRKRVSFLRAACRDLELEDVAIVEGRAEEAVRDQPALSGAFDVAVSRAVGRMEKLGPIAFPYLKPDGCIVVSAGPGGRAAHQVDMLDISRPGGPTRRFVIATRQAVSRGT